MRDVIIAFCIAVAVVGALALWAMGAFSAIKDDWGLTRYILLCDTLGKERT